MDHKVLVVIWLCFLAKGSFFACFFPLWEGYDEFAHFGYVQTVALQGKGPTEISREVEASLRLIPLPWSPRTEPSPSATHDAYWKLPEAERSRREAALRQLAPQRSGEMPVPGARPNYEVQQPRLYYWLMAPMYWISADWGLPERVWLLRMASVGLASLAIPLGFFFALELFGDGRLVLCGLAVFVAMPGPVMSLVRVSNEALAIVLATALLVAVIGVVKRLRISVGAWMAGGGAGSGSIDESVLSGVAVCNVSGGGGAAASRKVHCDIRNNSVGDGGGLLLGERGSVGVVDGRTKRGGREELILAGTPAFGGDGGLAQRD